MEIISISLSIANDNKDTYLFGLKSPTEKESRTDSWEVSNFPVLLQGFDSIKLWWHKLKYCCAIGNWFEMKLSKYVKIYAKTSLISLTSWIRYHKFTKKWVDGSTLPISSCLYENWIGIPHQNFPNIRKLCNNKTYVSYKTWW